MKAHDATEQAYKNGYRNGTIDTALKMQEQIKERCIKGGIYPAFVARTVETVAKEIMEEIENDKN